jgi:tetratricopeptide (TPR) repeat protein
MQLFADRFVIDDDGAAIDLATGRGVALRRDSTEGLDRTGQLRWSLRCDRWLGIHHRAVARLIDFGLVGRQTRFEAWLCGPAWSGSDAEAIRIQSLATRFLAAAGLSADGSMAIHAHDGVAVVLPGDGVGHERSGGPDDAVEAPLAVRGLARIRRPAVAALAELFDEIGERRAPAVSLWGEPGAGTRVIVHELARAARLKGMIPVAARLLQTAYAPLWRGRALFVVHDQRDSASPPWRHVLGATLETPLPHAVMTVGRQPTGTIDAIGLPAVAVEELTGAVLPSGMSARLEERVRRAATDAKGKPGRFARLLWPDWARGRAANVPAQRHRGLRAAEDTAIYALDRGDRATMVGMTGVGTWPSPGELTALRGKVAAARTDLARGRHAPALRALRLAASAFARRDAWNDAGAAALAVARALHGRGRTREALVVLEDVRRYGDRSGDEGALLDAAIVSGEARIDSMRLGEAETILSAAVTTATLGRDPGRAAAASIALARCLFWRGLYDEAERVLERCAGDAPRESLVRRDRLAARVHVGRGDIPSAIGAIAALKRDVDGAADPAGRAAVACTAAFVYLAVGDLDAASREARDSIAAARTVHDPLRAVRARLLLIEAERRRGRFPEVARDFERLKRIESLPPIIRARYALEAALARGDDRSADRTGALALFAPEGESRDRFDAPIDNLLVILRACQTAEDEAIVLKEVCAHVRHQVHAIAAAFVIPAVRSGADVFVGDGGRIDVETGERALTAGIVIRPHRHGDRIGGAAPVLYGGASIGALCVRWSLGSEYDADRAASVLAMAATAAAPMLAAAIAHRARAAAPQGAAVAALLGLTPAMENLRRAAERAGAAPFPVLIVGESGSGKELVARAIHRSSRRRAASFCTLNCAALPDDLV